MCVREHGGKKVEPEKVSASKRARTNTERERDSRDSVASGHKLELARFRWEQSQELFCL